MQARTTRRKARPATDAPALPPNRLMGATETSAMLGIHRSTLYALSQRGDGPPSIQLGSARRWALHTVLNWIARREEEARSGQRRWGA